MRIHDGELLLDLLRTYIGVRYGGSPAKLAFAESLISRQVGIRRSVKFDMPSTLNCAFKLFL